MVCCLCIFINWIVSWAGWMSLRLSTRAALVSFSVVLLSTDISYASDILRVGGTGAALEMVRHLGSASNRWSGSRLDIVPNLGSSGGIKAAAAGAIDLAVSGRPLTPAEKANLTEVAVAHTPFELATSVLSIRNVERSPFEAMLNTARPAWPNGMPVQMHPSASERQRHQHAGPAVS